MVANFKIVIHNVKLLFKTLCVRCPSARSARNKNPAPKYRVFQID